MTYNHSPGTQKSYVYALKQYCQYFGVDLREFLRKRKMRKTERNQVEAQENQKQATGIPPVLSEQLCTEYYTVCDDVCCQVLPSSMTLKFIPCRKSTRNPYKNRSLYITAICLIRR